MNILTGKTLSRRNFLQGMGVTVALPYLDAMLPSFGAARKTAAAAANPTRFVAIEVVHGAAGSTALGGSQFMWAPQVAGRNFDLIPDSALLPLKDWREYLTIVSNTDVRMAEPIGSAGETGG